MTRKKIERRIEQKKKLKNVLQYIKENRVKDKKQ